MVKYSYNFFDKYKSFDIIPYQEVVDSYIETQTYLASIKDNYGGDNFRPINSDEEHVDHQGFWGGFSPAYFDVSPTTTGIVSAKADVVSMDMVGLGKTWDHFVYFELPVELFLIYQTGVHSNPDISIFKSFMEEVNTKELNNEEILILAEIYDKLYPKESTITTFFQQNKLPAWRQDIDINQYISIKNQGLIYPICFNSWYSILKRGTHRAIMLASTGSKVPVFMLNNKLGNKPPEKEWKIDLAERYGNNDMHFIPDFNKKTFNFYKNNELVLI